MPRPKSKLKTTYIRVRLSEQEKALINKNAEKMEQTLSDYVREKTLNTERQVGKIKRALTIAKLAGVGCELSQFDVIELAGFIADMEQTYDEDRIRIAELENELHKLRLSS